jgi:hypothetical protein
LADPRKLLKWHLSTWFKKHKRLAFNEAKTKFMEVTMNPKNTKCLTVGNYTFEKVCEFKYRDTLITSNNNLSTEIHHRLQVANRCYLGRRKQPRFHRTRINTELKL